MVPVLQCLRQLLYLAKTHIYRIVPFIGLLTFLLFFWYDGFKPAFQDFRSLSPVYSNITNDGQLLCSCPRTFNYNDSASSSKDMPFSTCGRHATMRGGGQNVVAYTHFGSVFGRYFEGAEIVIKSVGKMYPGWTMRLYHNVTLSDPLERGVLCHLWCLNSHLDLCDVRRLPPPLHNKSEVCATFWRFFVLGDPLIDKFLLRDMDSIILQREVDSVNCWLKSGRTWHVMRDFPDHDAPILAGMFGGLNGDLTLNTHLRKEFIANGVTCSRTWDQEVLANLIWPLAQPDMIAHDSYHCLKFEGSQAWPTQRLDKQFVGDKFPWKGSMYSVPPCPKQCRPTDHQDWTYC